MSNELNESIKNASQSSTKKVFYSNIVNKQEISVDASSNIQIEIDKIETSKQCNLDIGSVKLDVKVNYVASFTDEAFSNLKDELNTSLTNSMYINPNIIEKIEGLKGTSNIDNKTYINSMTKSMIDNISKNEINEQLASFNVNVLENIKLKDISCTDQSKINIGNVNIVMDLQIEFVSKILSNKILDNPLYKILQSLEIPKETTTPKSKLGLILSLILIVFIFGISIIIKRDLIKDWKLWLLFVSLCILCLIIYYYTKSYHDTYSISYNDNGYRLNKCIKQQNGPFNSYDECNKNITDPQNVWYYDRFWGYDPIEKKCKRYKELIEGNITAIYSSEDECIKNTKQKSYWTPIYMTQQKNRSPDLNKPCTSNVFSYYDTDNCEEKLFSGNVAITPLLSFDSKEECIEQVKFDKQNKYYYLDCLGSDPNTICQFYKTSINNDKLEYDGNTKPFINPSKDDCKIKIN